MFDIETLVKLVPALPLLAAIVTAALGRGVLRGKSHWPAVAAIGLSLLASLLLLFEVSGRSRAAAGAAPDAPAPKPLADYERIVPLWTWAWVPQAYQQASPLADSETVAPAPVARDFRIEVVLRADPLTAVMLAVVTFISLLVAVYSIGYMRGDPGYWRFFTYLALFVFSMTMLVSASNFAVLYVFWEGVGLCSYLLIGFWFRKREAAAAGMKAFLVNRVGDFGFALAIFLLWITYGTLDFHDTVATHRDGATVLTPGVLGESRLLAALEVEREEAKPRAAAAHQRPEPFAAGATATAICLLLMLGACGKSAQFPLHVWLPDAMEGPTPVSALIHAATMVTAGVYLVARCMPLFAASPQALQTVATLGGVTALMAAVIAVTQTDLKRILAYSTISQLGFMFLGLGVGTLLGVTAGMFHLVTHAFFKALLFLAAGSVMHAMGGVIDITRLGGLRRRLPVTHLTFLVGCLALAGVVPFAGFWSKDGILAALHEAGGEPASALYERLYWLALATAALTAFYAFRALARTFYGPERIPHEAGHHAHESPAWMTVPLVILAVGSVEIGAHLALSGDLERFLARTPSLAYLEAARPAAAHGGVHWVVAAWSTAAAASGIALAALLYLGPPGLLRRLTALVDLVGLYRLSHGKMFFDQAYHLAVVWPLRGMAQLSAWVDRHLIDGLVDLCGRLPAMLGAALRSLQIGLVPFYALAMVLGLLAMLGALLM